MGLFHFYFLFLYLSKPLKILKTWNVMEKRTKIILGIVIAVVIIGLVVWITFFYYRNCENKTCFEDSLSSCGAAKYTSTGDMVFQYTILRKTSFNCIVNVKLLQGDLSNQDSLKLEGKEMQCYLPLHTLMLPESDINNCHGELKEGLQGIIIEKLHDYIVQNLGQINAELLKIG